MRIIALSTLKAFISRSPAHADAREPLMAWYRQVRGADWATPADVKRAIGSASILNDGRAVFNIAGNKYRIVVWINYPYRVVYVRFVGTHRQQGRHDRCTNQAWKVDILEISPIKTQRDYRNVLKEIEGLMIAKRNTPAGDRLDVLVTLVEAWERKHYPMDLPDPVEAIKYHMGSKWAAVTATSFPSSAIATACTRYSRKRSLTLKMIWRLARG